MRLFFSYLHRAAVSPPVHWVSVASHLFFFPPFTCILNAWPLELSGAFSCCSAWRSCYCAGPRLQVSVCPRRGRGDWREDGASGGRYVPWLCICYLENIILLQDGWFSTVHLTISQWSSIYTASLLTLQSYYHVTLQDINIHTLYQHLRHGATIPSFKNFSVLCKLGTARWM